MYRIIFILLVVSLYSCSGIQLIDHSKERYYSTNILNRVESIKKLYAQGEVKYSLQKLSQILQEEITNNEKSFVNNLIGVINFSKQEYALALRFFEISLDFDPDDPTLEAQLYLNKSSALYKTEKYENAFDNLKKSNFKFLDKQEQEKFHLLNYLIADKLDKKDQAILGLIRILSSKSISQIRQSKYWDILVLKFSALSINQKIELLDFIESEKIISSAYLAYLEAEKQYYIGEREISFRLIDWIKIHFEKNHELASLINAFELKLNEFGKFDAAAIGVILPLSGKRKKFGLRAMKGIDLAFQLNVKNQIEGLISPQLHIRDSKSNPIVGANMVRDLIKRKSVSLIIGGLDSNHAGAEYLEAKKYGVTYISLASVYLTRDKKDPLLFEVPGSPQSIVASIIDQKVINKWGKKVGIFYSEDSKGKVYRDEFWRASSKNDFNIVKVMSYDKKKKNFKDSVSNFLNLKYKREREEELNLWSDIYSLKRQRIRRTQVLKPMVDFDWVFLSSYPQNTVHIIPYFNWLDAYKIKFLGGPSWKTSTILNFSKDKDPLYFVSNKSINELENPAVKKRIENFKALFYKTYEEPPRLVEVLGLESMDLAYSLIKISLSSRNRNNFYSLIKEKSTFDSLTGQFVLQDNIWIKKLNVNKIYRGNITKF
jgi:outer membrane PBP1 activator LpoA protein